MTPQPVDPRDLLIEVLAHRECGLLDQIVAITIDRDAYRTLALAAIGGLQAKTAEFGRLRAAHERLRDEYRQLREQIMRQVAA